jgi:murein DD-endopeptidase MepM/ murein hydrolase activator NlpD
MQKQLAQLAIAALLSSSAAAQTPTINIAPAEPLPGSIVRLSVTPASGEAPASIRGTMAGEPLHFMSSGSGTYHAIGAVPVDADSARATVYVERRTGVVDTMMVVVSVPPPEPAKESTLAVDQRFTRPLDARTQARIARENQLARTVARRAHDSPPRWTEAFAKPRDARVTSQFGTGRMFNGVVASRHLGVDFSGAVGTEVRAANRGVVALVDTFFLAGRLVYVDHGGGVMTGYFHLSKPLVSVGDTVAKGQRIGLVGATGRVTGPHLHWTARYGALTVNPLDLIDLPVADYSAEARKPEP